MEGRGAMKRRSTAKAGRGEAQLCQDEGPTSVRAAVHHHPTDVRCIDARAGLCFHGRAVEPIQCKSFIRRTAQLLPGSRFSRWRLSSLAMTAGHLQWRIRHSGIALALLFGLRGALAGGEAGAPQTFAAFRTIVERNIFDPARAPQRPRREKTPPPIRDELVLVGTMSYGKGDFAFFSGSSADLRRESKPGERIGGLLIAEVAGRQIKLKQGEQQLELAVGACLVRENGGPWRPGGKAGDGPWSASATNAQIPPVSPAEPERLAARGQLSDSDQGKSDKWAKKLEKHMGETSLEKKEAKMLRKMLDGDWKDGTQKPGKQDGFGG
jgi:hypothetical protein